MSDPKHTPGPWEVRGDRGDIFSVCKGFPQKPIAKVLGQETREERAANARLIAAAPAAADLLAALRKIADELSKIHAARSRVTPNQAAYLLKTAKDAIRNAEEGKML